MNIEHRSARLGLWAGALIILAVLLAAGLRAGSGLLLIALALGVGALLLLRLLTLLVPALGAAASALAGRIPMPQPKPAPAGESPDMPAMDPGIPAEPIVITPESPSRAADAAAAAGSEVRDWVRGRIGAARAASDASAQDGLSFRQRIQVLAALCAFGIPLALRFFKLDTLQSEVYGDINIVFEYLQDIRAGLLPFNFILSSGPLYHYLIAPVIALTGLSYDGLKIASALTGMLSVIGVYLLGRRLISHSFGLLAAFVTGVTSWLLIFSRLGNSQIVVPALVSGALWLMARHLQTGGWRSIAGCAALAALGLYAYPQSFAAAPALLITLITLRLTGQRVTLKAFAIYLAVVALLALPFIGVVSADWANFFDGYIGGKFFGAPNPMMRLLGNFGRSMAAFHVSGDSIFRSNAAGQPHLDVLSGLLMLAGALYWLTPARRRLSPLLFVPFILLQLPAMLVINFQGEVPSASRTLGVAPIATLLAASGLWWAVDWLRRHLPAAQRWVAPLLGALALLTILGLNMQRYFGDYIAGLPYGNVPVARVMRQYVDSLPPETNVYLYHCCWQEGMPEPKSIRYEMARPEKLFEVPLGTLTCENLRSTLIQPAVLLWDHNSVLPESNLGACRADLPGQLYSSAGGQPVFRAAPLVNGAPAPGTAGNLIDPLLSPLGPAAAAANEPALGERLAAGADRGAASLIPDELMSYEQPGADGDPGFVLIHSALDLGQSSAMLDGSKDTVARGRAANPFVLEYEFNAPRALKQMLLDTQGLEDVVVLVQTTDAAGVSATSSQAFKATGASPTLALSLPHPGSPVARVHIELLDRRAPPGDGYHMHIYEARLE